MKHLCRISLTWAIVFVLQLSTKFYLQHKELQYKIDQQKLIEQHLQNKKVELELMNKLQGNSTETSPAAKKQIKA
jgi:hypothetical protein